MENNNWHDQKRISASFQTFEPKSRHQSRIKIKEYYMHDMYDNKDPRLSPLC